MTGSKVKGAARWIKEGRTSQGRRAHAITIGYELGLFGSCFATADRFPGLFFFVGSLEDTVGHATQHTFDVGQTTEAGDRQSLFRPCLAHARDVFHSVLLVQRVSVPCQNTGDSLTKLPLAFQTVTYGLSLQHMGRLARSSESETLIRGLLASLTFATRTPRLDRDIT